MISFDTFLKALESVGRRPNKGQSDAVSAAKDAPLFVVAGPGTGKTACLTMRMLKLIYVDGVAPRGILATTFTKKAAGELRSRLLSWGYGVHEYLLADIKLPKIQKMWLEQKVDINQVWTGTIDSLCEELLRDFRDPGTDPPVLADEFVSGTLLLREGMFGNGRYKDAGLARFLAPLVDKLRKDGEPYDNFSVSDKTSLVRTLWDRRHHDQLYWTKFIKSGGSVEENKARNLLDEALTDYAKELNDRIMVDFSQLEQTVLDRLVSGGMKEFTDHLEVVLVDEYQDSNLMQEKLYFELAKRCNGALTVVGDDDQSLYRFRGATVDLFSQFDARYGNVKEFKQKPLKVFLNENYRSSTTIIDFVNAYANLDSSYQTVRVKGKPALVNPKKRESELPILGMFRETLSELATDLAQFIHDVTRGKGRKVNGQLIQVDAKTGGDVGDCALLCSSPQEWNSTGEKERLPLCLKIALADLPSGIQVFNPRGQDFSEIPIVRRLGGLLLMCIDPTGDAEDKATKGLGQEVCAVFQEWATETTNWLKPGKAPQGLIDFVARWGKRDPGRNGYRWPKNTPSIDLLYALVHWLPELHDDPEGQVYLEVFTRQLSAAEQVSPFKARIVSDMENRDLTLSSVGHLLLYFLAPVAAGTAKVDEDLIDSFPRDRLNVLSIHQSKGLEFPLVIVDVGADFPPTSKFPKGHHGHAFKRFPRDGGTPHRLEDLMRPHSPLATLSRGPRDRAFDDIYRQFFVAFSRPQDALLLVGLNSSHPQRGTIRNVATGWDRQEINRWQQSLPFVEI
jgi:DNA helicase-2/ATP-dependent DNA helicase PcrA